MDLIVAQCCMHSLPRFSHFYIVQITIPQSTIQVLAALQCSSCNMRTWTPKNLVQESLEPTLLKPHQDEIHATSMQQQQQVKLTPYTSSHFSPKLGPARKLPKGGFVAALAQPQAQARLRDWSPFQPEAGSAC